MRKEELTPDDTGVWKVTTLGSEHTFDFEHLLYTRTNTSGMNPIENDGTAVPFDPDLLMVWPKVGSSFLMLLNHQQMGPFHMGQVRLSSEVQLIEEVT